MKTNETARSRRMSLARSAVFRAVRLLIFGLIGWLWFVSAADSAWRAVSLAAVLALAALVGITWYLSRVRAERRWRACARRRWIASYAETGTGEEDLLKEELSCSSSVARSVNESWCRTANWQSPSSRSKAKTVRLGISAPEDIAVYREEVWQQLCQETHGPPPKG